MTIETQILNELKAVKSELHQLKRSANLELLTIDEICEMLKISRKHIYAMIKTSGLPSQIKIGSSSRWKKVEIETWVNQQIGAA